MRDLELHKSKRVKPRTSEVKMLNAYLDDVYAHLLTFNKQLICEFKLITSQSIKSIILEPEFDLIFVYSLDEFLFNSKSNF